MVDVGFSFPPDIGPRRLLWGLSQTRVLSLLAFTEQASGFTKPAEDYSGENPAIILVDRVAWYSHSNW
jgi:hypothetical protein